MTPKVAANYAEFVLSSEFRGANGILDRLIEDAASEPKLPTRDDIDNILVATAERVGSQKGEKNEKANFHLALQQELILAGINNPDLLSGSFFEFTRDLTPDLQAYYDVEEPDGEPGKVATNSELIRLSQDVRVHDPFDFFNQGLRFLEIRKKQDKRLVGPENPATLAHFFERRLRDDKISLSDAGENPDLPAMLTRWTNLLLDTCQRDKLNKIEIGNIFKLLPLLQRYAPNDQLTYTLAESTLRLGAEAGAKTAEIIKRSLAKTDADRIPKGFGLLFNQVEGRISSYERVSDYYETLRALSKLDPSTISVTTYKAILEKSHGLCDATSDFKRLRAITWAVADVIAKMDEPRLTEVKIMYAQRVAEHEEATKIRAGRLLLRETLSDKESRLVRHVFSIAGKVDREVFTQSK